MRVLPLAEAKTKLSELVSDVVATDEPVTITRNGRATAVLVSFDEFESWQETADILADPDFARDVRRGLRELDDGRGRDFDAAALNRLCAERPRPARTRARRR